MAGAESNSAKYEKDKDVKQCRACLADFSVFSRKHHCRVCGRIFCAACSDEEVSVKGYDKLQRACFGCFSRLQIITEAEQRLLNEAVKRYQDTERAAYLVIHTEGKTRKKGTLIVGKRFLMGLERGSGTDLLMKKCHIIDLASITSRANVLQLEFGAVIGKKRCLFYETPFAQEIIKAVRESHRDLTIGSGVKLDIQLKGEGDQLLELEYSSATQPVAGAFFHYYSALCAAMKEKPSDTINEFVEELYFAKKLEIDLQDCPGIDTDSTMTFNMKPFFLALAWNSYFRSLVVQRVKSKTIMTEVCNLLQISHHLTRLVVREIDCDPKEFARLGTALQMNPQNVITDLCLSQLNIGRAIGPLALALGSLQNGLRRLELSGCRLGPKSLTYLFENGLMKNLAMSLTLEELNLSDNRFEEEGSESLQKFLLCVAPHCKLKRLVLSKCQLNLALGIRPLHLITKLEELDISNNPLNAGSTQLLCAMLETSNYLRALDVSYCGLQPTWISSICSAISNNRSLYSVTLSFKGHPTVQKAIHPLTQSFTTYPIVHTLDLSHCKLGESHLIALCKALKGARDSVLDTLYLDRSKVDVTASQGLAVATALNELIQAQSGIKKLSLAKGFPNSVLLPFLEGLRGNQSLLELNVANNKLSDIGGAAIAKLIRSECALMSIECDNNKILLPGYQAILMSVKKCTSLHRLGYPWMDLSYALNNLPKGKPTLMQEVLTEIIGLLAVNRHKNGTPHPRFEEIQGDLMTSAMPLALVPENLLQTIAEPFVDKPLLSPEEIDFSFEQRSLPSHSISLEKTPAHSISLEKAPVTHSISLDKAPVTHSISLDKTPEVSSNSISLDKAPVTHSISLDKAPASEVVHSISLEKKVQPTHSTDSMKSGSYSISQHREMTPNRSISLDKEPDASAFDFDSYVSPRADVRKSQTFSNPEDTPQSPHAAQPAPNAEAPPPHRQLLQDLLHLPHPLDFPS